MGLFDNEESTSPLNPLLGREAYSTEQLGKVASKAERLQQARVSKLDAFAESTDTLLKRQADAAKIVSKIDWSNPEEADQILSSVLANAKNHIMEQSDSYVGDIRQREAEQSGTLGNTLKAIPSGALNLASRAAQLLGKGTEVGYQKVADIGSAVEHDLGDSFVSKGLQAFGQYGAEASRKLQQEQIAARQSGLFDKTVGYDPAEVQQYGARFADNVQRGEYVQAVKDLAHPAAITAFAQSIPEMVAMATPLGLASVMAANVNENLTSLEQNAQKQNIPLTDMDRATSAGLSVISTYLDRLGDRAMLGDRLVPQQVKDGITLSLSAMTPTVRNNVLSAVGDKLAAIGIRAGEFTTRTGMEGATEGLQTIGEGKASDVTKMNMNLTPEESRQALEATGVGLGAGGVGTTSTMAPQLASDIGSSADAMLTATTKMAAGKATAKNLEKIATAGKSSTEKAEMTQYRNALKITQDKLNALDENSPTYVEDKARLENEYNVLHGQYMDIAAKRTETPLEPAKDTQAVKDTAEPSQVATEVDTDALQSAIKHFTSQAEEQGRSSQDIQAAVSEIQRRFDNAGFVSTLTKADREAGLNIEALDIHDQGTRSAETAKKKSIAFDPAEVNDQFVATVLEEGLTKSNFSKIVNTVKDSNLVKRLTKKLGYGTEIHKSVQKVHDQIKSQIIQPKVKQALTSLTGETQATPEKAMRIVALAVSNIRSATIAEFDIRSGKGLTHDYQGARVPGLDVQLGKSYMNSYGLRVAGEAEASARKYAEIGQKILSLVQEMGLAKVTQREVPIHNMVDAQGNPIYSEKHAKAAGLRTGTKPNTIVTPVVSLTTTSQKSKDRVAEDTQADALTVLSKLLNATNYEMVSVEPVTTVPTANNISKEHIAIIQEYNKLKYKIKPEAIAILKELKAIMKTKAYDSIDKLISADKDVQALLGLENTNSALNKMSESGRAINRKGNLTNLLDNLEMLEDMMDENDGFNFNYESAINDRIHVMQTILDFQGDKYMARQILSGNEYTTESKDEYKLLLDDVADNLGLHKDHTDNVNEVLHLNNPTLKKAIETMSKRKDKSLSLRDLVYVSKKLGFTSPFKALSVLRGIYDIQQGKGEKVTTNYMIESDATASGVVNTLLNLSGYPAVQKVLGLMGIGKYAVQKGEEIDPYNRLNSLVEEQRGSAFFDQEVAPIIDSLTKMGFKLRDLAKPPVMTWFYGQADANTQTLMGNSIAVDVANKAIYSNEVALQEINRILGTKKYTMDADVVQGVEIKDISEEDIKTLTEYYADTVGKVYVEALPKAFPNVMNYRKVMGEIYTILEKTGNWKGTIGSAMATQLDTNEKMSIQKLKSLTVQDLDKELLLVNKMMNNKTSFNVNLQHATDAALLLMTLKDVLKSSGTNGIMTIHDAFMSDPKTALKIMKAYNQYTVKVAQDYDYTSAAIKEASQTIAAMKDGPDKKHLQLQLDEIKSEMEGILDSKKDFLKDVKTNILGNKDIDIWGKSEESEVSTEELIAQPEVESHNANEYRSVSKTLSAIRSSIQADATDMASVVSSLKQMKLSNVHKALLGKIESAVMRGVTLTLGDEFSGGYNQIKFTRSGFVHPSTKVKFTPDTLVEIIGHELDHAIQFQWMTQNRTSSEMKYLTRIIQKLPSILDKVKGDTKSRIEYIMDPKGSYLNADDKGVYQVAELVSVLSNEIEVAADILNQLNPTIKTNILETIKKLVMKAYATFKDMVAKNKMDDLPIDTDTIMSAIQSLDDAARVNTQLATNEKHMIEPGAAAKSKDIYPDIFLDPFKYANDIIAKQNAWASVWMIAFGNNFVEFMSPYTRAAHIKAKRSSPVYKEVVSLLKAGFVDSEFAQKFAQTVGLSSDSKKALLSKLQNLGTEMMQHSVKVYDEMAKLDTRVQTLYPDEKDQVTLYQLFAKTGIANITLDKTIGKGLMDGSMTIAKALSIAGKDIDPDVKTQLDKIADYYVNGVTDSNAINPYNIGQYGTDAKLYTTLSAMAKIKDGEKILHSMDADLKEELMKLTLALQAMNGEINEKVKGWQGHHTMAAQWSSDFDGHYTMDIHEKTYEYRMVTELDMKSSRYSSEFDWVTVKQPTKDTYGLVARESLNTGMTPGVGLNINKYQNGFYLDAIQSEQLKRRLDDMRSAADRTHFLKLNGIIQDGNRFRFLIDEKTKVEKLHMKQNVAHSLYRTYVHNKELIESQSIRDVIIRDGIQTIATRDDLVKLNNQIKANVKAPINVDSTEIYPFLKVTYDYGSFEQLAKDFPYVVLKYKTPSNLSTYNDFNKEISFVKKAESDVLIGHKNFSIFGDSEYRSLARIEKVWKQLIILAKQKMVVTHPVKLVSDTLTNLGILTTLDMSPKEIYDGFTKGWKGYHDISQLRGELVLLELEARLAFAQDETGPAFKTAKTKVDKKVKEIQANPFYDAYQAGFIQSYSTDLVIKEFDTISGLQKDIDEVIDKLTFDRRGNPNALHKAIKSWMHFGFGVDTLLAAAGKSSKLKGTSVGDEMLDIANRLKTKKDMPSVSRYVSEIIGSPSSEVVTYGGAAMVITDALSKYALAEFLLDKQNPRTGKIYTKDEAYTLANDVFIDYRFNLPAEIKTLSDYGVLLFPAFWLRVQKVIAGLIKYHPLNAIGGYAIETAIGANQLNVINEAFPFKFSEGSIMHDPTTVVGPEAVILGW